MVKGLAVQIKTKCFNIFFRFLPMIYKSNQQHRKMVGYRSSLERRGLCLPGPLWGEWALPETGQIFILCQDASCQILPLEALLSVCSPCANGLFPLVQCRSWRSGLGQLYFWPSSTNLNKNMTKVSIGCGAAARICMTICIACVHVGQMLFAGNKYLLLKRITVQCRSRNSPGFDPSFLRHNGIWGAADE